MINKFVRVKQTKLKRLRTWKKVFSRKKIENVWQKFVKREEVSTIKKFKKNDKNAKNSFFVEFFNKFVNLNIFNFKTLFSFDFFFRWNCCKNFR